MTERERKILVGKKIDPVTADEAAIATAIDNAGSGGGGSDLPTVTSDDNGDVLTVVEGAWAKAEPSGGKDFVITFTVDSSGETPVYIAEHDGEPITIAEIYAAKQSGITILGHDERGDLQLVPAVLSETIAVFSASVAHPVSGQYVDSFIGTHEDDTDTWVSAEFSLPAPSADANGKVLGVDDGEYALVENGAPLVVHGTATSPTTMTSDMTAGAIVTAFTNGKTILVDAIDGKFLVVRAEYNSGSGNYIFSAVGTLSLAGAPITFYAYATAEDATTFNIETHSAIPSYTSNEAGYVLKVNASGNGLEWVAP